MILMVADVRGLISLPDPFVAVLHPRSLPLQEDSEEEEQGNEEGDAEAAHASGMIDDEAGGHADAGAADEEMRVRMVELRSTFEL